MLLFLGVFARAEPAAPRIPVETFFAEPDCRSMQLAPDGKHLAFLTTLGFGKVGIALMDLATGKYDALVSARDENIKTFFWKGSDYIIYAGDIGGEESYAWRSIPIEPVKPGKPRRVVALAEAYRERYNENADFMQIVDRLKYDPRHLLIYGRREKGVNSMGMMLIDVSNGRRSNAPGYIPASQNNRDVDDYADNNGILRVRIRSEGKNAIVEVRPRPDASYVQVREFPADQIDWSPMFFAADNENLYLFSTEASDTPTLHTFNVRTRELSPPIYRPPEGELDSVLCSWDRSKLYGVSYEAGKPAYHFIDPDRARLQQAIDRSLPDTFNQVVGASTDENILLILASSDRDPGTYYVFDRAHGRLGPVGKVQQAINPAQMRPMEVVNFTARDGLPLQAYLTRPAAARGVKVPLVIIPHGGPFGVRDSWGYDPESQFLANRGYAVLKVNYRGSSGYGVKFMRAGFREWGGRMQDDLTDAVKWVIQEGIADPAKVAIYGASYGGYATLVGLTSTPELYCCGANYVGPSDLSLLVGLGKNDSGEFGRMFYREYVGDQKDYLRTRSPVNFIERLRVPLLNAYGYNDPRVDFRHWTRLEAKLKEHKKPYEIIIESDEGHGFHNEKNRIAFYQKLDEFLARHLGSR